MAPFRLTIPRATHRPQSFNRLSNSLITDRTFRQSRAAFHNVPATITILDCEAMALYEAYVGNSFPPDGVNPNPGVAGLPSDRLCLFAMASTAKIKIAGTTEELSQMHPQRSLEPLRAGAGIREAGATSGDKAGKKEAA